MGVGALGLPWAAARLGWIASVTTLMVFAFCSTYSGVLLARCRVELYRGEGAGGYGDLAVRTVGPCFGAISRTIIVANWGLLLPYYLLTAGKSLIFIAPNAQICDWEWTAIMALAVVLPMQVSRALLKMHSLARVITVSRPSPDAVIYSAAIAASALPRDCTSDASPPRSLRRLSKSRACAARRPSPSSPPSASSSQSSLWTPPTTRAGAAMQRRRLPCGRRRKPASSTSSVSTTKI